MRRLVPLFAVFVLVGSLAAPSVSAAEPKLEGSDVVWYDHDDSLVNSETSLVQGTRTDDGGCSFSGEETLSLPPGTDELLIRTRELAYDPSSCVSLMETGTPTTLPSGLEPSSESGSVNDPSSSDLPSGSVGILTHARYKSWQRLWYEEPAQQSVGEVTNTVVWRPDATCASPTGGEDESSWALDWLEQTGWRLISHDWRYAFTCDQVMSYSVVHYKNQIFCITVDTDVYYDVAKVEGLAGADGQTRFTWEARKFGGCSALLAFKRDTSISRID